MACYCCWCTFKLLGGITVQKILGGLYEAIVLASEAASVVNLREPESGARSRALQAVCRQTLFAFLSGNKIEMLCDSV